MKLKFFNKNLWWGPPKNFSTQFQQRKISWLELFYDLVYVIAISKITHHLSEDFTVSGFTHYAYLFSIIYWGWLNGSFYHDLHGSNGLRTNLMTLWQMIIVAALSITLSSHQANSNTTIAIIAMQLFITYLWWSVGLYDKQHRKLNIPYTICYLLSFALLLASLFVQDSLEIFFQIPVLIFNYLPPFILNKKLQKTSSDFSFSESMTERLGLFSIILFGEIVLGVINGFTSSHFMTIKAWLNFGLTMLIVFSLWWLFFSMIADKEVKAGFWNSNLMALIYIPTLISLSVVGISFKGLFSISILTSHQIFCSAIALFLIGIITLCQFLKYPLAYQKSKQKIIYLFLFEIAFFLCLSIYNSKNLTLFLIVVFIALLVLNAFISKCWFALSQKESIEE